MRGYAPVAVSILSLSAMIACGGSSSSGASNAPADAGAASDPPLRLALDRMLPIPETVDTTPPATEARVALGKMLFFEKRLSKNHDIACVTCHALDRFGVDGAATSTGHRGQRGGRNAPTVLNAALLSVQFWDGRAQTLEEQATGPIQNPIEMAADEPRVVATLGSMPEYVTAFADAFAEGGAITLTNVGRAIGAYERRLLTPSRFDGYLRGDEGALSDTEKAGGAAFARAGCPTCHRGAAFGGGLLSPLGSKRAWPPQTDQGRFDVTGVESDRFVFKVPTLRNVVETGPYLHDGSASRIEDVVRIMGEREGGVDLSEGDVSAIVAFLGSMKAAPSAELVSAPTLPPSTSTTPAPDPN